MITKYCMLLRLRISKAYTCTNKQESEKLVVLATREILSIIWNPPNVLFTVRVYAIDIECICEKDCSFNSLTCKSGAVVSINEVGTSSVIETDEVKQANRPNKNAKLIPTGTIRILCAVSLATLPMMS